MQSTPTLIAIAVAAIGLIAGTFDGMPANTVNEDAWRVTRVGGDLEVQTEYKSDGYRAGVSRVEEALPVGYPTPTPPGAIELKRYPEVRRAEFRGSSDPERGSTSAFFPLFNHISERNIAMTSPVEVDYTGWRGDARSPEGWTMSFLYRTPDLGPLERDGDVVVVDQAPMTVLSLGLRGGYGADLVNDAVVVLGGWLREQGEWLADGGPRAVYYNGPNVPDARKWAEVQIPVRRADDPPRAAATSAGVGDAGRSARSDRRVAGDDIIDATAAAGSFKTLAAALDAAELVEALRGEGPFTVLAPTDDAFAALPADLLESLLRPENKPALVAILTYHVIPGRLDAAALLASGSAATLQGEAVAVELNGGSVRVNDARVVINDLAVSNGVIHAIDSVLLPPSLDLTQRTALTPSGLIELAVERGAPLFNDGQPVACAAIYEVVSEALLAMPRSSVPAGSRRALVEALAAMRTQHDPREKAWTLRRALDSTYEALSSPLAASDR